MDQFEMKEAILSNLENHSKIEIMYRENKNAFKKIFNDVFPDIQKSTAAQIWHERLNFESEEISWGTRSELTFVFMASAVAALLAKIPEIAGINPEYFYSRNIAFIVFPLLTAYFAFKQQLLIKRLIIPTIVILISVIYINLLPDNNKSDTLILACIHLPIFLWTVLGSTFVGNHLNSFQRRLDFLKYNGDLIVMTTIMLIAGGILTAITLGLFALIDLKIEELYFQYVVVCGLAAAPIVATYLVQTNPHLVNKVSPVIARLFTPIVFVMLVVYLGAVIYTGKDPFNDREFLLIFNLLLIGVMALILFSVAEISKKSGTKLNILLIACLAAVTIIVNGIALSAILFRISEWGITPNRLAVLGGNVLILVNLLIVSYKLFGTIVNKNQIDDVEKSIAAFLPVYSTWTIFVIFIIPVLFDFK